MKKRGQITTFIIVGILILLSLAIFFFYQRITTEFKPEQVMPTKEGPVQVLITGCVDSLSERGIRIMGQQGGYIKLPLSIKNSFSASIREDSAGLLRVPYWYIPNDPEGFITRIPSLNLMESQIEDFVSENLRGCLDNFSALNNSFQISALANYTVKADITNENVVVRLHYPLRVKSKLRKEFFELSDFVSLIPVRLKRVHELASELMLAENEQAFFEHTTINLMGLNPNIPFNGLEFGCGKKQWTLNSISSEIKRLVSDTIPRIRVDNTDYRPFSADEKTYEKYRLKGFANDGVGNIAFNPEGKLVGLPKEKAPEDSYEYFHFFFKPTVKDYTDLTVDFIFNPDWPINVLARPSHNGVLSSSETSGFADYLKFLCVNVYHFTYDVAYPLEGVIRDDKSFNGVGYNYKFAFPVLIKNNLAARAKTPLDEYPGPPQRQDLCSNKRGDSVDIRAYDAYYFRELKGANISFTCIRDSCLLGKTVSDNGFNRLRTQLPDNCANGDITAIKDLYLPKTIIAKPGINKIYLTPLKRFNFTVKRLRNNYAIPEPLESDESVIIQITAPNTSKEYNVQRVFCNNPEDKKCSSNNTINLIDADTTYNVFMLLTEKRGDEDAILGGYQGNWSVKTEDYINKNNVEFKVYAQWSPRLKKGNKGEPSLDQLRFIANLQNYSVNLTPSFKS